MAEDYFLIVSIGLPPSFIVAAVTGIFNGSGNSRTPFYISTVGLILNMVLDPVFIFTLGWGIKGAAWATILAQFIAALLSCLALMADKGRPFPKIRLLGTLKKSVVAQITRWSTPIFIEGFLFTFLSMIITRLVASWGSDAVAAQRIGSQVESLSWLIAGGFSSALTAFVGQNYGAGKWNRIHRSMNLSIRAMAVWGVTLTALLFFCSEIVYRVFVPNDPNVISIGGDYLKILAMCQLLACVESASMGAFRGLGQTLPPSVVSITSNALRVVAAYILSAGLLGLNGVWIAISAGSVLRGGWMFIWYLLYARRLPRKDTEQPVCVISPSNEDPQHSQD